MGADMLAVGDCFLQPQVASIISMLIRSLRNRHGSSHREATTLLTRTRSRQWPSALPSQYLGRQILWFVGTVTHLRSTAASKALLKELTRCLMARGFYLNACVSGGGKWCHLTVSWGSVSASEEYRQQLSKHESHVLPLLLFLRLCWLQRHLKDLGRKLSWYTKTILLSPSELCHVYFLPFCRWQILFLSVPSSLYWMSHQGGQSTPHIYPKTEVAREALDNHRTIES